jgi:hypothetical protein
MIDSHQTFASPKSMPHTPARQSIISREILTIHRARLKITDRRLRSRVAGLKLALLADAATRKKAENSAQSIL